MRAQRLRRLRRAEDERADALRRPPRGASRSRARARRRARRRSSAASTSSAIPSARFASIAISAIPAPSSASHATSATRPGSVPRKTARTTCSDRPPPPGFGRNTDASSFQPGATFAGTASPTTLPSTTAARSSIGRASARAAASPASSYSSRNQCPRPARAGPAASPGRRTKSSTIARCASSISASKSGCSSGTSARISDSERVEAAPEHVVLPPLELEERAEVADRRAAQGTRLGPGVVRAARTRAG